MGLSASEDSLFLSLLVKAEYQCVEGTKGHIEDLKSLVVEEVLLHEVSKESELLADIFSDSQLPLVIHAMEEEVSCLCDQSSIAMTSNHLRDLVED